MFIANSQLVNSTVDTKKQWPMQRFIVQEGQHPLTEQRAANFRLLANQ